MVGFQPVWQENTLSCFNWEVQRISQSLVSIEVSIILKLSTVAGLTRALCGYVFLMGKYLLSTN